MNELPFSMILIVELRVCRHDYWSHTSASISALMQNRSAPLGQDMRHPFISTSLYLSMTLSNISGSLQYADWRGVLLHSTST